MFDVWGADECLFMVILKRSIVILTNFKLPQIFQISKSLHAKKCSLHPSRVGKSHRM